MLAKTYTFTKTALYVGIYFYKALSVLVINLDHFQSQKYTKNISAFLYLLDSNSKQRIAPWANQVFSMLSALFYWTAFPQTVECLVVSHPNGQVSYVVFANSKALKSLNHIQMSLQTPMNTGSQPKILWIT